MDGGTAQLYSSADIHISGSPPCLDYLTIKNQEFSLNQHLATEPVCTVTGIFFMILLFTNLHSCLQNDYQSIGS